MKDVQKIVLLFCLIVMDLGGDGNCFIRALSKVLFRHEGKYLELIRMSATTMKENVTFGAENWGFSNKIAVSKRANKLVKDGE